MHEVRTLEGQFFTQIYWTVTPETQVCSCSQVILFCDCGKRRTTGFFQFDCFSKCAAITVPRGSDRRFQAAHELNSLTELAIKPETCWNVVWPPVEKAAGSRAKMRSRARKEASAQEVRGYYKQFAEGKHLEYKSWVDNEVFDLIDMRKVKTKNGVTERWVLTIKTDKQGNFLKAKARCVLRGFQEQAAGIPTNRWLCFHKTRISDESPDGSQQKVDIFLHTDLKTTFFQGQSYDVNPDIVCQLPPEVGHPPYIAAR